MSIQSIASATINTLGNPNSMIPLAVKDVINSVGFTYYAGKSGKKVEAQDRFIDEFGTQAIWLLGIKTFKKAIDKTAYKFFKANPSFDIRTLEKNYKEVIKPFIPDSLKQVTDNALKNEKLYKRLAYSKFAISTGLTLGAYYLLTKVKQLITYKQIEKDFLAKQQNEKDTNIQYIKNRDSNLVSFSSLKNGKKQPAFKGAEKVAQAFMFNPVMNTMIIDAGITSERLGNSRNKSEFLEYTVKEGGTIAFLYGLGRAIQPIIDKVSLKLFKTPVKLNPYLLSSNIIKESKPETILSTIADFTKKAGNSALDAVKYVLENQSSGNVIVEAAKKSGVVQTIKNGAIDTTQFIDGKAVKTLANNLKEFVESASKQGVELGKFAKKAKLIKAGGVAANIGICCLALGWALPKIIYEHVRPALNKGQRDFHVAKEAEQKLALAFKQKS